jgi:hypothetical protein
MVTREADAADLRRVIRFVAILNLAYFGIEFAVALAIGSVSLFADSIGLLEDASVNLLILVASEVECAPTSTSGNGTRWHPARPRISHRESARGLSPRRAENRHMDAIRLPSRLIWVLP